jgi:hypothetical protein
MMARLAGLGALLAVLATFVTGCGVGSVADEGKISDSADTYLRSLAEGDVASACEQLTPEARAELIGGCGQALRQVAARIGADRLDAAADGGVEIDVDETTASANVRELNARLTFVRGGASWRIERGYRLESR